jgi:hypothetical protein
MMAVLRYVAEHPGRTNQAVACAVGPNGSHAYGDRLVRRCHLRGLIADRNQSSPLRSCAWELTPAGRIELEADAVRRSDILALLDEAWAADDAEQIVLCRRALVSAVDGPNWQACARAIATARLSARAS